MAFKNGNNWPRNRSTNNRSLSNRISTLQKEINPCISASGQMNASSKRYVTRKLATILVGTTSTVDVTAGNIGVPDGAKVLSLKVYSLDTRILNLTIPNETGLTVNNGSTAAPFGGLSRTVAAPLSRFPMIKINIPDPLSAPIDVGGTVKLFTLNGGSAVTTPTFRLVLTAKYLA